MCGVKVVIMDMNKHLGCEVCEVIADILLNELSVFGDQTTQHGLMLACLSSHTEVIYQCYTLFSRNRSIQVNNQSELVIEVT